MAQLVARFHGMEEVRGSNPLSSTIEDVLEHLTSLDAGSGARAAKGSASRIVALSSSLISMPFGQCLVRQSLAVLVGAGVQGGAVDQQARRGAELLA